MILAINIGIFIFLIIIGGLMLVGALVTLIVMTIIYKKDKLWIIYLNCKHSEITALPC
jgi:hypothetical protein